MKFVFLSDTHGLHKQLELPSGDVLIHAGDLSPMGRPQELRSFFEWFSEQPHRWKICIAGNHDFMAENNPEGFRKLIPDNCIYLENTGITIEGVKIWGSPVTPWYYNWAFNRQRGEEIRKTWENIPYDIDVLITHGPPHGILDRTQQGIYAGCEELHLRLLEVKPKVHVFGHIHEAHGEVNRDGILYINASVVDLHYRLQHAPVELEIGNQVANEQ